MTVIGLAFIAIWSYLARVPSLLAPEMGADGVRRARRAAMIGPVAYGLTILLPFVSPGGVPDCLRRARPLLCDLVHRGWSGRTDHGQPLSAPSRSSPRLRHRGSRNRSFCGRLRRRPPHLGGTTTLSSGTVRYRTKAVRSRRCESSLDASHDAAYGVRRNSTHAFATSPDGIPRMPGHAQRDRQVVVAPIRRASR
jgi:hypothetical protein